MLFLATITTAVLLPTAALDPAAGDWKQDNGFMNDGTRGSAWNGIEVSDSSFRVPIVGSDLDIDRGHTIMLELSLPAEVPTMPQWILHFGKSASAHEFVYGQGARDGGWRVMPRTIVPGERISLLVVHIPGAETSVMYLNGESSGQKEDFVVDLKDSELIVGTSPSQSGTDFKGQVFRVRLWDQVLSRDDVLELHGLQAIC